MPVISEIRSSDNPLADKAFAIFFNCSSFWDNCSSFWDNCSSF